MKERVASVLPGFNRPIIVGEYPYYRASPSAWESNLRELKRNGIDVISFYVPWRFHELHGVENLHFDFSGATDPQRDLLGLLRLVSTVGLKALIKPGPFIHAEVQLGGLPDRLCDESRFYPVTSLIGLPLLSQGRKLPSLFDPAVREQVRVWLEAVEEIVIRPHSGPNGPIVAIQLGNEGIYSDAGLPLRRYDASVPAVTAFWLWMQSRQPDGSNLDKLPLEERLKVVQNEWPHWAGASILENWRWLASFYDVPVPRLVNVPLVRLDAPHNAFSAWMVKHLAFRDCGYWIGHTEWVGNAASDRCAFMSHLIGIVAGRTDTLEANWGFTWADSSFAEPHVPLFHALLGLLLGSTSCSVYTACATQNWGSEIDLDADGLKADGLDPSLYGPPYCPGAPTREDGSLSPNAKALQRLSTFLQRFGAALLDTELVAHATVQLGRQAIVAAACSDSRQIWVETLWSTIEELLFKTGLLVAVELEDGDGRALPALRLEGRADDLDRLHRFASDLLISAREPDGIECKSQKGSTAIVHRRSTDGRTLFVGLFNPGSEADQVTLTTAKGEEVLHLPAASARIHVYEDSRLIGSLDTLSGQQELSSKSLTAF